MKSEGSEVSGVRGLEFKMASICAKHVDISSSVKCVKLRTRLCRSNDHFRQTVHMRRIWWDKIEFNAFVFNVGSKIGSG